jgi:hypothetical protein
MKQGRDTEMGEIHVGQARASYEMGESTDEIGC